MLINLIGLIPKNNYCFIVDYQTFSISLRLVYFCGIFIFKTHKKNQKLLFIYFRGQKSQIYRRCYSFDVHEAAKKGKGTKS